MLSELELGVVDNCKIHKFGAYLQRAYLNFGESRLLKRNYPTNHELEKMLTDMSDCKKEFDTAYFIILPNEDVNPLQTEQTAWRLFSPLINDYLQRLNKFTKIYSQEQLNDDLRKDLIKIKKEGYDLLQKWNIISNSFKPKDMERLFGQSSRSDEDIQEKEDDLREFIQELSIFYYIN